MWRLSWTGQRPLGAKKGLPRTFGHRKGMEALERTVEAALDFNIKYLTLYAFSTENWKRPLEEVGMLMNLLIEFVDKKIAELDRQGVRMRHIGSREHVAPKVLEKIKLAEERTSHNDRLILNLAFNYGQPPGNHHGGAKNRPKSADRRNLSVRNHARNH